MDTVIALRQDGDYRHSTTPKDVAKDALFLQAKYGLPTEGCPLDLVSFAATLQLAKPALFGALGQTTLGGQFVLPQNYLIEQHIAFRWLSFGMPTFRLTEDLAAALALTDPYSIPLNEIKPPFPTFFIHLPFDMFPITLAIPEELRPYAPEALKARDRTLTYVRMLASHHCSMVPKDSKDPLARQNAWWVMCFTRDIVAWSHNLCPVGYQNFDEYDKTFGDWRSLVIPAKPEDQNRIVQEENRWGSCVLNTDDADNASMEALWRILIGVMLYITEHGRGRRAPRYSDKVRKKHSVITPMPDVWILGQEIHLGRDLIEAARSCASARKDWRVRNRFTVRGHWKMQPCGPLHAERKRIWIAPYWKGPTDGTRLAHIYDLEKSTST